MRGCVSTRMDVCRACGRCLCCAESEGGKIMFGLILGLGFEFGCGGAQANMLARGFSGIAAEGT